LKLYVNYTINPPQLVEKTDFQAGPYHTMAAAEASKHDIESFEGISNCWIGDYRDEGRRLIENRGRAA
jgi:hypothetical protein